MTEDVIYTEMCKPVGLSGDVGVWDWGGVVDRRCQGRHHLDALWRMRDGPNKSENLRCLLTLLCEIWALRFGLRCITGQTVSPAVRTGAGVNPFSRGKTRQGFQGLQKI